MIAKRSDHIDPMSAYYPTTGSKRSASSNMNRRAAKTLKVDDDNSYGDGYYSNPYPRTATPRYNGLATDHTSFDSLAGVRQKKTIQGANSYSPGLDALHYSPYTFGYSSNDYPGSNHEYGKNYTSLPVSAPYGSHLHDYIMTSSASNTVPTAYHSSSNIYQTQLSDTFMSGSHSGLLTTLSAPPNDTFDNGLNGKGSGYSHATQNGGTPFTDVTSPYGSNGYHTNGREQNFYNDSTRVVAKSNNSIIDSYPNEGLRSPVYDEISTATYRSSNMQTSGGYNSSGLSASRNASVSPLSGEYSAGERFVKNTAYYQNINKTPSNLYGYSDSGSSAPSIRVLTSPESIPQPSQIERQTDWKQRNSDYVTTGVVNPAATQSAGDEYSKMSNTIRYVPTRAKTLDQTASISLDHTNANFFLSPANTNSTPTSSTTSYPPVIQNGNYDGFTSDERPDNYNHQSYAVKMEGDNAYNGNEMSKIFSQDTPNGR